MATRNDDVKSAAASKNAEAAPAPARVEDEAALRAALEDSRLRVKHLARREIEAEAIDEETLHFRLKGRG